jgi:hemolysin type calcium-binding protein
MPGKWFRKRLIALALVLLGVLLPAASAQAALGLTANPDNGRPDNLQAGAHSNFHVDFNVTGTDQLKTLKTELPPGLVGNPQAPGLGLCVPIQLVNNACPANSRIGSATSQVTATVLGVPQTLTASGFVYNVLPQGSDPATLGVVLNAELPLPPPILSADPVVLIGHASARSNDYGLDTTIRGLNKQLQETDIPNTSHVTVLGAGGQDSSIHIDSSSLTLNGSNPQFMTNPTSCKLATTKITASSYQGDVQTIQSSFTPACGPQKFAPHLGVTIDMTKDAAHVAHPDLITEVTQGVDEANQKRVEAIMPKTLQPNNAALVNQCPLASFQASSCPQNTQVGSAVARTPLLSKPLEGPVYLIANPGFLPRIGLDLKGPLPTKLLGNVAPTPDFRLDNVFGEIPLGSTQPELPDVPLSQFRLTFSGGKDGLITAPKAVCQGGPNTYDAIFDSWGGQHVTQSGNATVKGCAFAKRLKKGRCDHKRLTDVGTKHHDVIKGTRKRDVINGLGGADKILGLKGNDLLCGGAGKDKIAGGPGKDKMFGGRGRDLLLGGGGKDKMAGGPGKDRQVQ